MLAICPLITPAYLGLDILLCLAADSHLVVTAFVADDIAPLEVVGSTLTDKDGLGTTRALVVLLVGTSEQCPRVVELLIAAEIGCLCLVE